MKSILIILGLFLICCTSKKLRTDHEIGGCWQLARYETTSSYNKTYIYLFPKLEFDPKDKSVIIYSHGDTIYRYNYEIYNKEIILSYMNKKLNDIKISKLTNDTLYMSNVRDDSINILYYYYKLK